MRHGCHCNQSTDTAEKGGWGVPLTADQMKCAFACSNPDLVQSQLSPDLQRNSPSWYLAVKVHVKWHCFENRGWLIAVDKMLGCSGFPVLQKSLWDPVWECDPEDRVGYPPASSVPTPVRDLLQHLKIFVTSNLKVWRCSHVDPMELMAKRAIYMPAEAGNT